MLNADELGARIRTLRKRQGRTLDDIARFCGLTRSMISKLENGQASPSVATLTNIAAALDVPITTLLADAPSQRKVFISAKDAHAKCKPSAAKGYSFFPFATERAEKSMQPFLFTARRGEVIRMPLSHTGEEFLYMLKGRMRYFVGGSEYILQPGDSLYYDAEENHDLEPLSASVEYLAIFGGASTEAPKAKRKS